MPGTVLGSWDMLVNKINKNSLPLGKFLNVYIYNKIHYYKILNLICVLENKIKQVREYGVRG